MIVSNPANADGTDGVASSASADNYLARRQGNLKRSSDGFRSPTLATDPRRPFEGGHRVDPPLLPYAYNPRPPETVVGRRPPRNFAYFRQASLGAPYTWFPDLARTRGKLQQSGEAWGRIGERERVKLTPAVDGRNEQPSHAMGENQPGVTSSIPKIWYPGRHVTLHGRKAGSSTAE